MDLQALQAFRADLGDIPVEDNPKLVQLKSRDFYWYSPVLKRKLGHVTADLVVAPRSTQDVVTVLASAHRHGVPVTPRGAGTGNYGQAMPLSGGVILDLAGMNKVLFSSAMTVRAEAGAILAKIDAATQAEHGAEMRFHPSTYRTATLGGFIAGGSGGVGSIRWGGLRNFGNIIGLKVVTCEATPRILDLVGTDILKVAHAYGTNGIIVEAEIPLTAAYRWIDVLAGFPASRMRAGSRATSRCRMAYCSRKLPRSPPRCRTTISFATRSSSAATIRSVVMMAAPQAMHALSVFLAHQTGEMLYRSDQADAGDLDLLPPAYELTWNHTTLRALKVDPSVTYLQTQYPDLETLGNIIDIFGDEMPMHNEMIRFDGRIVFSGLPIVPLPERGASGGDHPHPRGSRRPRVQPAPLHAGGRRHEAQRSRATRLQARGRPGRYPQPGQDDRLREP